MQETETAKKQFLSQILNTRAKQIVALVLAMLLLIAAVYCMLRFGFAIDVLDRSGLKTEDGVVRYQDYFGKNQTGWQYIDGKLYYFAPQTGAMVSGWQEIDGVRYYFDPNGVRQTGWQYIDGKTYYLDAAGKMVTGWQIVDEGSYYFGEDGAMSTGWQLRDGKRSYFSDTGVALTGWQRLDGKLYFFTADSYAVTGWQELDNVRFYFDENGVAVTGFYQDETGAYYFDEDSHPHNGWLDWNGKKYYCNPDGTFLKGWLEEGEERYYFREDGTMAIGEVKLADKSHFFTSQGKYVLLCNPWNPVPEDHVLQLSPVEGYQFDKAGSQALLDMLADCRAAELKCTINNTYRSKSTQQRMWDESVADYMEDGMTQEQAEAETAKSTAFPGHSEHQTGLAVDLNGSQETYDWLAEHCWDYGFILRYPPNKIEITGIMYEPWHFRYVGTELSLEMKELGLCMEEYMTMLTEKSAQPAA